MFGFFCPADEYSAEAVEPADGSFYNPASRFEPCVAFDFFCFFSAWAHVECEAEFFCEFLHFAADVSCVKAQVLFAFACWLGPFYLNVFKCWARHFYVMPVGAVCSNADWHSFCFNEQTSFCAYFCPVCRVFASFFFRRVVLLSLRHPLKANAT